MAQQQPFTGMFAQAHYTLIHSTGSQLSWSLSLPEEPELDTTEQRHFIAFLQDSCQKFYGPGWLTLCQCYLKIDVVGEGPGATLSFETFAFSN